MRARPRSGGVEAVVALVALAVIAGLGLCLVHLDDHGGEDACLLLAAWTIAPALLVLPLPTGRLAPAPERHILSDPAGPFPPPPRA
jgi:hypothetical protein